jgi:hypothetical protein
MEERVPWKERAASTKVEYGFITTSVRGGHLFCPPRSALLLYGTTSRPPASCGSIKHKHTPLFVVSTGGDCIPLSLSLTIKKISRTILSAATASLSYRRPSSVQVEVSLLQCHAVRPTNTVCYADCFLIMEKFIESET